MREPLEPDIEECLARDFPADALPAALSSIAAASSSPRIQRCIAFAARGHPSYFDYLCKLARIDYRDVIMAAEYDRFGTQLYDFNQPVSKARLERT
jgi:hypothetical protein